MVTKRGRVYYAQYVNAGGKRVARSTGYGDRRLAEQLETRWREEARQRRDGLLPPEKPALADRSFGDAIQEFLEERRRQGLSENTLRTDGYRLHAFFCRDGRNSVASLSADAVEKYLRMFDSPGTANTTLAVLREFASFCAERGWLEDEVLSRVKRSRSRKVHPKRAFTTKEVERLLEACPSAARRFVYRLALTTGFRRNELRLLERLDLDFRRKVWSLRPEITKSKRGDTVPALDAALNLLTAFRKKPGSTRLCPRVPKKETFDLDLQRAGLKKTDTRGRSLTFHSFRYSFCVVLSKVLPLTAVQRYMRHSTVKLTADLYADLGLEDLAPREGHGPVFPGLVDAKAEQEEE